MIKQQVALHRLGWKAFQDLCVAIAEERLQRPIQTFLPTNDAGRDGAFVGRWDGNQGGESTIQCKFTSKEGENLTLTKLNDELPKAKRLAKKGLADDYIILTNHPITGQSELKIREAFEGVGAGRCRVFARDWILDQIEKSPRLRMMVPRLYGLIDIQDLLDDRAYKQAQLILSEMGLTLQKLVVTEAHRKSVRAISKHNLVLLLGSPAAGKSTIGASLALGASDMWNCGTIKATSPENLEDRLDPNGGQFVWIDDAWGSTQYQRERTEAWNQIFPLMQGVMVKGTRFLITSRDYIWKMARFELKIQALPILSKSQVIIDVHKITTEEKARILYNHLKLGDQDKVFRAKVKPLLPGIAESEAFLPESARRFGNSLFTGAIALTRNGIEDFFARPKEFLEQTIENLAPDCRAAIALVFLNGGVVRSPVSSRELEEPASAFGVSKAAIRSQLDALNGSLLKLAEDEEGPYWTYFHPTTSDAFASYVAKSAELVEIYLRGAKPESIVREVVCAGIDLPGALVKIPNGLHDILEDRIGNLDSYTLGRFISYRSNRVFSKRLLDFRPDIWKRLDNFYSPLKDDPDVDLLTTLFEQGLLPEKIRKWFADKVRDLALDFADSSFLENEDISGVLTEEERCEILDQVEDKILNRMRDHVRNVASNWDRDYDPNNHFDEIENSLNCFADALADRIDVPTFKKNLNQYIVDRIWEMEEEYKPPSSTTNPIQQSAPKAGSLEDLFRDVDE